MTVSARSVIFVIALACVIVCTHAGYDAGAPVGRRIIDKLFQAQPSSLAAASADSTAGNVTQGAFYVSSDLSSSSCAEQAEAEFLYGYVTNTCFPSDSGAESFVYTCSNTSVTQYVYSDGVCGTHIKSNSIAGSACVDLGDLDGDLQTDYGTLTCVSNTSVLNFTQQYILEQFYSSGKCVNSSLIEWQGVTNNTCVQGVRYTYPNVSFYGDTACEHKTTSYELRWDYCEAYGKVTDDASPALADVLYELSDVLLLPTAEGVQVDDDNDDGGDGDGGLSTQEMVYIGVGAGAGALLLGAVGYYAIAHSAASASSTATPLLPAV